jgi:hypothetical protein
MDLWIRVLLYPPDRPAKVQIGTLVAAFQVGPLFSNPEIKPKEKVALVI